MANTIARAQKNASVFNSSPASQNPTASAPGFCIRDWRRAVVALGHLGVGSLRAAGWSTNPAQADVRYKAYAAKLMRSLPSSSAVQAGFGEISEPAGERGAAQRVGRPALKTSSKLLKAARAQAAEMVLGNFRRAPSHPRRISTFGDRIRAYMPDFEDLRGENAARDRKGSASAKSQAASLVQAMAWTVAVIAAI